MLTRMKELVEELSRASEAYYKYDKPIMTDKAYDKLYDEMCIRDTIQNRKKKFMTISAR